MIEYLANYIMIGVIITCLGLMSDLLFYRNAHELTRAETVFAILAWPFTLCCIFYSLYHKFKKKERKENLCFEAYESNDRIDKVPKQDCYKCKDESYCRVSEKQHDLYIKRKERKND